MKNPIVLFIFTLFSFTLSAQSGIIFFEGTWDQAVAKAKQENKKLFVDAYTTWCGPCKKMAKQVFPNAKVGAYYNANYICLKLDAEKEKDSPFFKSFTPKGFPSLFFIDEDAKLLELVVGYLDTTGFIDQGKRAKESKLFDNLAKGRQRWKAGDRSFELFKTFVLQDLNQFKPDSARQLANEYFESLPLDTLLLPHNAQIMCNYNRIMRDDYLFKKYISLVPQLDSICPNANVYTNMYQIIVRVSHLAFDINDGVGPPWDREKKIKFIQSLDFPNKNIYLEAIKIEELLHHKQFDTGIDRIIQFSTKYQAQHNYLFSELFYTLVISNFFKTAPNKKEVEKLIPYAKQSMTNNPNQRNLFYVAALYSALGDLQSANEYFSILGFYPRPILSQGIYKFFNMKVHTKEFDQKD